MDVPLSITILVLAALALLGYGVYAYFLIHPFIPPWKYVIDVTYKACGTPKPTLKYTVLILLLNMSKEETTLIRVKRSSVKRLWNLVNSDRRTIGKVVEFLLDSHEKKREVEG